MFSVSLAREINFPKITDNLRRNDIHIWFPHLLDCLQIFVEKELI